MIGAEIGSYRIVSRLGAGGMGEVWLAEHISLERRVAVKVLLAQISRQPDMVERFFDEARAAARIDDPGIVTVHDFGWHDGAAYIVMEYLAGESLADRLTREHRLLVPVALRLVRQLAMTMHVAHESGIIHRDLKPENIFVVPDPAVPGGERIKVLDFGIAKLLGDDKDPTTTRTRTGVIMGTPMYMSPEQCRGAGAVDHRTDIYALGCVLYHLLCGRPPFVGATPGDMIASHLLEDPPPVSALATVSAEVEELLRRCLAKSLDDRYATMLDVERACSAAIEDVAALVPTSGTSRRAAAAAPTVAPSEPNVGLMATIATGSGEPAASVAMIKGLERRRRVGLVLGLVALAATGITIAIAMPREAAVAIAPGDAASRAATDAVTDAAPDATIAVSPDKDPVGATDATADAVSSRKPEAIDAGMAPADAVTPRGRPHRDGGTRLVPPRDSRSELYEEQ